MKRVYYDVIEKYADMNANIDIFCKRGNSEYDASDSDNYLYEFEGQGFFVLIKFFDVYFANCGFLPETQNIFDKCKEALIEFKKHVDDVTIYAKVDSKNMTSAALVNALSFEQVYKIYEHKGFS